MLEKQAAADIDRDALGRDMESLAQRMGSRLVEFKNRGELAQRRGALTRLAERHRQLRLRFAAATGPAWDLGKNDFSREHGDLFQEFVKFEAKLDKSEQAQAGRVAGGKSGLV